tara:strand:+ start:134 stop:289 length:156 start_codon:yes stop_codon:yes gene_type:complete
MDKNYGLGSTKVAVELHKKRRYEMSILRKFKTSFLPHHARPPMREMWSMAK